MTKTPPPKNYTSAEELRTILTAIHKQGEQSRNDILADFLVFEFGLGEDKSSKFRGLQLLIELVQRVQNEASGLDLEPRYLEQIVGDTNFFRDRLWALGSNVNLATFISSIPLDKVESLRYVEMVLAGSVSYENLDEEAESILSVLDALCEDVLNSGLPQELKQSVYNQLSEIRQSVSRYRIWGAKAIERSVFSLTGELVVNTAADANLKNEPVTRKITELMGNLFNFLGRARKAGEDGTKLIDIGQQILEKLPDL